MTRVFLWSRQLIYPCMPLPPPFPRAASKCGDANRVLAYTNYHRALHGAPSVRWTAQLASDAQAWADQAMAKALSSGNCFGSLQHAVISTQGENLYMAMGGSSNLNQCSKGVLAWYSEVADYITGVDWVSGTTPPVNSPDWQISDPSQLSKVGHFTQLVWRSTDAIGCGGEHMYMYMRMRPARLITMNAHSAY